MATGCASLRNDSSLYNIAQIRAIESAALSLAAPGTLMQLAGAAVARLARSMLNQLTSDTRIVIAVGPGNNGGDALVAAALLASHGLKVSAILVTDEAAMTEDSRRALSSARQAGVMLADSMESRSWSLAIDGLFGIGLSRALEGRSREIATQLNQLRCPVLAIDVPSGLDADTGNIIGTDGIAVHASTTLTFIANKPGLHTLHGRDIAGRVSVDDLGIDPSLFPEPLAALNSPASFATVLQPRSHASHKGSYGDLHLIGGAEGMSGALILAARMALLAGAGRVLAGFAGPVPAFDSAYPELMCRSAHTLTTMPDAIVIGPGLGMSRHAHDLLGRALSCARPLVIDADGLNLIASEAPLRSRLAQRQSETLLTPHPLEAARLLGVDVSVVQADRLGAANELANRYRSSIILKGSGSIVARPGDLTVINTTGNPALATAGSGDVLAGLCGALLAQGCPVGQTARAAVWLHGHAADRMVADGIGPIGAAAGELILPIRAALNTLVGSSAC